MYFYNPPINATMLHFFANDAELNFDKGRGLG
jgi:hypothetical protein